MRIVVLLALVGFMAAARTFTAENGLAVGSSSALAVGYLLLTAHFLGSILKSLHLPRLTGYLLAGMLAGGSGLDLLAHETLDNLTIFTGVAVALIALTAGTELDLRPMRPLMRTIRWITLIAVVGGTFVLASCVLALSPWLPFFEGLPLLPRVAFSLTLAVVLAAQSPAVVVALRTELSADGPVVRTVLGVVVIADLVVIAMFAAASTLAKSTLGAAGSVGDTVRHLLWELLGSIGVGLVVGLLVALYLRRVREGAPLFVLVVAFIVAEVGRRVALDPLLVALAAGVLIRNATAQGDALHHAIEGAALPVYLVFFGVAGATIHLDVLAVVGIPAVIIVLVRGATFLAGARVGGRIAGAPDMVRRFAGFGLLPQAGLALALSMLMQSTFGELGAQAGALTLGVVALNELLAPVAYRWALLRAGEAGQAAPAPAVAPELAVAPEPAPEPAVAPGSPVPPAPAAVEVPLAVAAGSRAVEGDDEPWPQPVQRGGTDRIVLG